MNSCESYQELISRLVDGEISHDEHEALMAHMKTCSRCNAMYAVFHDLSDILSEESEELPEGLHENIMAGVRRSDMVRKNRRMRKLGLRTALAAAACLVLVLFAASGFAPNLRAQDVAVRSAEQLVSIPESAPTPAPAEPASSPAVVSMSAAPLETPAPAAVTTPTPVPVQNTAPAAPDAYLASGDKGEAQYNTQQQGFVYQPAVPEYEENNYDYNPEPVYTPEQVYTPVQEYTPAQVYTPEPVYTPAQAKADDSAVFELSASGRAAAGEPEAALPVPSAVEEPEDGVLILFSSSVSDEATFDAAPEAAAVEDEEPLILAASDDTEDEGIELLEYEPEEAVVPVEPEENEESASVNTEERRLTVRGKEARGRLLSLLDGSEEALPEDAELSRVIHLTLAPEDAYSGEERLDILVYGDFVFYRLFPAEGGSASYRASCSLTELDGFLKAVAAAPTPTPALTPDPYAGAETGT